MKGAVEKARGALAACWPVWCLHELVHNETVAGELREEGMLFVESLDEVPEGGTVLFSAHGVPPSARAQAAGRELKVIDATCPFVARTHRQIRAFAEKGMPVAVVGIAEHVEVAGLVGEYAAFGDADDIRVVRSAAEVDALPFPDDAEVGVVCQTTLSSGVVANVLSALRARYPQLAETPAAETCTATRDRQSAVREFVQAGDPTTTGVLVIGSATSSNTLRLVEMAAESGARAMRADGAEDLPEMDVFGLDRLGITAGASTPEATVKDVVAKIKACGTGV